jgi:hypothetical protein
MDEDRKIRFLVAPILFVASLLLGAWADRDWWLFILDKAYYSNLSAVIGLIASGGVVAFSAGYVISTVNLVFLRLLFRILHSVGCCRSRFHEVAMSERALKRVWQRLGARSTAPQHERRSKELYAGAAFDFGVIKKDYEGVHQWSLRRWTAFNIATSSLCGLVLSFPFGHFVLHISYGPKWSLPVAVFAAILFFVAICAWHETMNMFDFIIWLPPKDEDEPKSTEDS